MLLTIATPVVAPKQAMSVCDVDNITFDIVTGTGVISTGQAGTSPSETVTEKLSATVAR